MNTIINEKNRELLLKVLKLSNLTKADCSKLLGKHQKSLSYYSYYTLLAFSCSSNSLHIYNWATEGCHIENHPLDPFLPLQQGLLAHLKDIQLGQVLFNVHLDEDPLFTQGFDEGVHVWLGHAYDGLQRPPTCQWFLISPQVIYHKQTICQDPTMDD